MEKPTQDNYDWSFKVLLAGQVGVGKTSLITRYVDGVYNKEYHRWISCDFYAKYITVDNKRIKLQIWDTIGQGRLNYVSRTYYRGAKGVILVYSVSDLKSFEAVNFWIDKVSEHVPKDTKIIIVGNMNDLAKERKVTWEDGSGLASLYNAKFVETSAKSSSNVDEVFYLLAKDIKAYQESNKANYAHN